MDKFFRFGLTYPIESLRIGSSNNENKLEMVLNVPAKCLSVVTSTFVHRAKRYDHLVSSLYSNLSNFAYFLLLKTIHIFGHLLMGEYTWKVITAESVALYILCTVSFFTVKIFPSVNSSIRSLLLSYVIFCSVPLTISIHPTDIP